MTKHLALGIVVAAGLVLMGHAGWAQPGQVTVGSEVRHDVSAPLSSIQPIAPRGDERRVHPVRPLPIPAARGDQEDPRLQRQVTRKLPIGQPNSFEGLGDSDPAVFPVGSAPADSTGAAGPSHFVEWVNTAFAIYDKHTGARLYGPAAGSTLWSNFGGACQKHNDGDPIVLYDRMAGRWLLSQFAVSGGPPYFECVAVSTTSDPLGPYARYAFQYDDFNDYPKFGVWPDAYYVTYNMFRGDRFVGTKTCALEREKMLAGDAARMICADVRDAGLLPADLDGTTLPPPNTPNPIVGLGPNSLTLWTFAVDWRDPSRSVFSGPTRIPVSPYRPACDGGACITQPGSARPLDSLADRLMFRSAYRNFGSHTSLVVNHTVSVALNAQQRTAGIRWYEIRNLGGTPVLYQQGTFAPDTTARWMGSVAMDRTGNILMGYSASSDAVHPSIRVTGRRATDPANTMSSEVTVSEGTGAQGLSRWGDYSSLTLDPADDCTFWFVTQYLLRDGDFVWRTRFAKVKFDSCK